MRFLNREGSFGIRKMQAAVNSATFSKGHRLVAPQAPNKRAQQLN